LHDTGRLVEIEMRGDLVDVLVIDKIVKGAAKARDFSRAAPLSTGETDSPLEGNGFERSVPR
jgi:hypothetical protein